MNEQVDDSDVQQKRKQIKVVRGCNKIKAFFFYQKTWGMIEVERESDQPARWLPTQFVVL